jgi:hypothetical protein
MEVSGAIAAPLLMFEELNCPLVLLSRGSAPERTKIPSPAALWIDLSRVETVLS